MQLQTNNPGQDRRGRDCPRDLTDLVMSPADWDVDVELRRLEAQWNSELRGSRTQREIEALMRGHKLPSGAEEEDAAREKQMRVAVQKAFDSMLPLIDAASSQDLRRQHNQELWSRIERVAGKYNRDHYLHRPDGGENSPMMMARNRIYTLTLFQEALGFLNKHPDLNVRSLGIAEVMRDYVCHNLDNARVDACNLDGGRHAAICGEIFAVGTVLAEKLQGQVEFLDWQVRRLKMK